MPFFDRLARRHDHHVFGLEHVPPGPCLLVGYHGRPAIDAFLLAMTLYRRGGRAVRGVSHAFWFGVPGLAGLCRGLGLVSGEEPRLGELLSAGEPVLVLPGGSRECFRSSRVRYTLDWGQRQGYARLALRHNLPIVPFVTEGADDLYRVYGDGYRLSKRLTGTDLLPICLPLGSHNLPFGPSKPVPLTTRLRAPIRPDPSVADPVSALDASVRAAMTAMLKPLSEGENPGPRGDPWAQGRSTAG
jgi:1-acyl-sn-glycerol-3-phosphate acyltransferase